MINENIPAGTVVKFTADARLRQINPQGQRIQSGMNEGTVIGEKLEAVVTQRLGADGYAVYFREQNVMGWTYNYELYVVDQFAPLVKLKHVPQKK
jgi:hypothetical protein